LHIVFIITIFTSRKITLFKFKKIMPNLKLDLKNKIANEKFYDELELIRLAGEPNMNYAEKVETMQALLENIAIQNAQLGLIEQYFQEPVAAPVVNAPAPAPAPQGQVHPGQTFGE
jgi:hypothetical protein